jgi:hypothetical protein
MKNVIINSIGTAKPSMAAAIADALCIQKELMLKLLYNAPSAFLINVSIEVAEKANNLLNQLGIENSIEDTETALPSIGAAFDVAVYIQEPYKLPLVAKQLSEFIGITENEAFELLLHEPSVVLGGVSNATVEVLQKNIDAEVVAVKPTLDFYEIHIDSKSSHWKNALENEIKSFGLALLGNKVKNLTYLQASQLWKKFPITKEFVIYNQSLQRHRILLEKFEMNNEIAKSYLVNEIGMAEDLLPTIQKNLPIILFDSIVAKNKDEVITNLEKFGVHCVSESIPFGKYKIKLSKIKNSFEVEQCINQLFKNAKLNQLEEWEAPEAISSVLNRYLEMQLESLGCEIKQEYA